MSSANNPLIKYYEIWEKTDKRRFIIMLCFIALNIDWGFIIGALLWYFWSDGICYNELPDRMWNIVL